MSITLPTLRAQIASLINDSEIGNNDIDNAINAAIDKARAEMPYYAVSETVQLAADTWEYTPPTGFATIHSVAMQDADLDFTVPILPHLWRLTPTPKLVFDKIAFSPVAGRYLRIEGMRLQPRVTVGGSDTIYIDPSYLTHAAMAFLHASRAYTRSDTAAAHERQASLFTTLAEQRRLTSPFRYPPGSRRVPGVI